MSHTVLSAVETARDKMIAAELYFGHGVDNAFDEACWLAAYILEVDPTRCDVVGLSFNINQLDDFVKLVSLRVSSRKPAAYLLGHAWFCGLPFKVNEHTLVPRSPIAEMIEEGYAPWIDPDAQLRILDLCTGSGCIGIASALACPNAQVDLADLSSEALAIAEENIAKYKLNDRVKTVQSDLYTHLTGRYDLIVSNPPYVPTAEYNALPQEYLNEPEMALEAGADGLDLVRIMLAQAKQYLTPNGVLIIEVGSAAEYAVAAFPELPFIWLEFAHGGDGVFLLTADQLP